MSSHALPPSLFRQKSEEVILEKFHDGAAQAWDPTGEDREQQQQAAAYLEAHGLAQLLPTQKAFISQWTRTAEESTFVFVVSAT